MRWTIRPISDRTPFGHEERASIFTVTWHQVVRLIDRELDLLDAEGIVLELDVDERQIRVDGELRSGATPSSAAVRLAFDSSQGPLTFATDVFRHRSYKGMDQDWRHNLYAIAKSLEALRLVDRYGVISRGEQYVGLKALPAGRAMPASHMTGKQAVDLIYGLTGLWCDGDPLSEATQRAFRAAKAIVHPDRRGDRVAWDQVEQAGKVLGLIT